MVPHFYGESVRFDCENCRFQFRSSISQKPINETAICPNCSHPTTWSKGVAVPAEICEINTASSLNRWDVVALMPTANTTSGRIKRIVGLPGERLQFQNGDLFINGARVQKAWPAILATRVLMFDSANLMQARFAAEPNEQTWFCDNSIWRFEAISTGPHYGKLVYQHERCTSISQDSESMPKYFPLEDYYAENQNTSRRFHPMGDGIFEMNVSLSADAVLRTNVFAFGRWLSIVVSEGCVELRNGTELLTKKMHPTSLARDDLLLVVAAIDHQIFVCVNETEMIQYDVAETDSSNQFQTPFLEWEAIQGYGSLRRVRIWRDLYFYDETSTDWEEHAVNRPEGTTIPDNSYFVLGDNLPVSRDSRNSPVEFVPRSQVLGIIKQ